MRDRPIIGLPLFSNLSPAEPNTWVGNVYNPEEGHIYTEVKVTVASRQQLVLRGCKAWLLCGEKVWTRSTLPAPLPTAEPGLQEAKAPAASAPKEPTIEAAAEPQETPQKITAPEALGPNEPLVETAAQEPEAKAPASPRPEAPMIEAAAGRADPAPPAPTHKSFAGASAPAKVQVQASAAGEAEETQALPISRGAAPVMRPVLPFPSQDAAAGYGFTLTTATPESAPPFSSEKVSTMFVITHPLGSATASDAPVTDVAIKPQARASNGSPIPLPNQKPKLKATPQVVKPQIAKPQATMAADASDPPAVASKPKPKPKPAVKQPENDLPWLQHP